MNRTRMLAAAFVFSGAAVLGQSVPGFTAATNQTPPNVPSRTPGETRALETGGAVSGRVTAGDTEQPLAQARVRLVAVGTPDERAAMTDGQGRYEFGGLPAGRYRVTASGDGYVTLSFGQRRPTDSAPVTEVTTGQAVDKIDFVLPRSAVITAIILDEHGEPIEGFDVRALQSRFVNGERRLAPVTPTALIRTDDRGYARIFGLAAGAYAIVADRRSPSTRSGQTVYARTFYPGTSDETIAGRLVLGTGQEATVTFAVQPVARVATVSGIARSSDGAPLAQRIIGLTRPQGGGGTVTTGSDGSFSFSNVFPGEYVITVGPTAARNSESFECARVPLTVDESNISGVAVTTAAAGALRGRFVFEGGRPPSNVAPGSLKLYSTPLSPELVSGRALPKADWTFEVVGLLGQRQFAVSGLPSGWWLKSITANGRVVTDTPIDFNDRRPIDDAEVVLTKTHTQVVGDVVNQRNAAVTDYTVVVFPERRDQRTPGSRFITSARPDANGRFTVSGLPPSRYLIAAIDFLEPGDEQDPAVLDRLQVSAIPMSFSEGEQRSIRVRLTP